jgi:hypothetical protein
MQRRVIGKGKALQILIDSPGGARGKSAKPTMVRGAPGGWDRSVGQLFDGAGLHRRTALGGMAKLAGRLVSLQAGAHNAS